MRMCSNFPLKYHRQLLPFLIQLQMQVLMLNPCNLADVRIMIEVTIVHSALSLLQVGHILFYFILFYVLFTQDTISQHQWDNSRCQGSES